MSKRRILAFGASNSKNSINRKLAGYVANQIEDAKIELIDLNDFEMPIYSIDRQKESGIPEKAVQFLDKVRNADGIVISFAEHNGAYTVAFKNIFDWASRIEKNVWMNKPMFLLAASDGKGGTRFVLETASKKFSHMSSNSVLSMSVPNYNSSFSPEKGFLDTELKEHFESKLLEFNNSL